LYVLRLAGRTIAHVTHKTSVLEPRIAALIEPCLLAYGVRVYLGEEDRTPVAYGYRVSGKNPDQVATAIKRCVAHVLHRKVEVADERIYLVVPPGREEGEGDELFEEA